MKRVAADLAESEVLTPDGDLFPLARTWRDRTVVLAFVRHFG